VQTFSIPIFPLPGLVLFPRTMVPLHVFEPRYVQMVRDALASDGRIATAQLRTGWEKEYFKTPPVYKVITVARILNEERLPDDRYNVLLEGVERAEVIEETAHSPYRVVRAVSLVDIMDDRDREDVREEQRELESLCAQMSDYAPDLRGMLTNLTNQHLHPGIIADKMASLLVKEAYDRQSLLGERRVLRRLKLVNVQLRQQLTRMQAANPFKSET